MRFAIKLSVIIVSTTNRLDYIRTCLNSLKKQVTNQYFEIILVLSGNILESPLDYKSKNSSLTIILGEKNNYCKKRNIGAAKAKGEIIAYIDDDAKAEPQWVDKICKKFKNEWKIAGGYIKPDFEIKIPKILKGNEKLIGGFNYLPRSNIISNMIIGCNMFLQKDWLLNVGGFDEYIGKKNMINPKIFYGGDEIEIIQKCKLSDIGFISDAMVSHTIQDYRITKSYILERAIGNGKVKRYVDEKYQIRSFNTIDIIKRYIKYIQNKNDIKKHRNWNYIKGYAFS